MQPFWPENKNHVDQCNLRKFKKFEVEALISLGILQIQL